MKSKQHIQNNSGLEENPFASPASKVCLRILVADDVIPNQLVAKKLLEKLGHEVDTVVNGLEAVKAANAVKYDIIFMDIQMPVMDGITATLKIRENFPTGSDLPIIAVTANSTQADREACLSCGMNDFLTKPITSSVLLKAITNVIAS